MVNELFKTYDYLANVYIIQNNEQDGIVLGDSKELLYENIKCGVSFKQANTTSIQGIYAENKEILKLFMDNRYIIPINSIIELKKENRAYIGTATGQASIYDTHQEIVLELKQNG